MRDRQKPVANHSEKDDALLTVVAAVIVVFDGGHVAERFPRLLEADLVFGEVGRCLGIIPFEFVVIHNTTVYPHFVKLSRDIARKIHGLGIDIMVDLNGYIANARPEVLSARPAPIQCHYLAFPGTLGTPAIDYMIVDPVIVRGGEEVHFTEALVRLPDSYQANDRRRAVASFTWVFGCATAVLHVIAQSRGKAVVTAVLAGAWPKVWVSDRLAAQCGHAGQHQFCRAHLLRDTPYAIDAGDTIFAPGCKGRLKRACAIGRRRDDLADSTLAADRRDLDRRLDRLLRLVPTVPPASSCRPSSGPPAPTCSCSSRDATRCAGRLNGRSAPDAIREALAAGPAASA